MSKKILDAYREAAKRYVDTPNTLTHVVDLRVNPHGSVQLSEGGAYVEMMLWVPESLLSQDNERT